MNRVKPKNVNLPELDEQNVQELVDWRLHYEVHGLHEGIFEMWRLVNAMSVDEVEEAIRRVRTFAEAEEARIVAYEKRTGKMIARERKL